MKDFILGLYANENFPIYLGAVIIVLLNAFFVVYFLGKKDKKKIEETQRLQTIDANAFQDVTTPVEADVQVASSSSIETTQEIASSNVEPAAEPVNQVPAVEAPVTPIVNTEISSEVVSLSVEPEAAPIIEQPTVVQAPVQIETPIENTYKAPEMVESAPVEKPMPKFNPDPVIEPYIPEPDLSSFNNLATSIETELNALEKQQELAKPIIENVAPVVTPMVEPTLNVQAPVIEMPVVPEVQVAPFPSAPVLENVNNAPVTAPVLEPEKAEPLNVSAEPKPTKVMTGVFSSVYAPKKEENLSFEETMAIELPKLKDSDN